MINNKVNEVSTACNDDNETYDDNSIQNDIDGSCQDENDSNNADEIDGVNNSCNDIDMHKHNNNNEKPEVNTSAGNDDNNDTRTFNCSENNGDYLKNNKSQNNKEWKNKNKNKKSNKKYENNKNFQNDNNKNFQNDNNKNFQNNNNKRGKNDEVNNFDDKPKDNKQENSKNIPKNWDINHYLFNSNYQKSNVYNNNNNSRYNNNDNRGVNLITGVNMNRAELIKKIFTLPFFWLGLKKTSSDPLDSFVLRLHYRFGAGFFFLAFLLVWSNILTKNQIHCIGMEGDKPLKQYILNFCLSYSTYMMPNGLVKPILFYRWTHFACLIVACSFLLLKLPVRRFGHPHVKSLFFTLNKNASKLDLEAKERTRKAIVNFFKQNVGSQRSFYVIYLLNHGFAPLIAFASFLFLDFVLQGQFWILPVKTFPFWRDPVFFHDPLSLVFTPFVNCTIGPGSQMLNAREEEMHCHLTLMELYEKVFICAWVYMVIVMIVGVACVCILACLPLVKPLLLRTCQEKKTINATKACLLKALNIGDIFLLFLIKRQISEKLFCTVLVEIKDIVEEHSEVKVV